MSIVHVCVGVGVCDCDCCVGWGVLTMIPHILVRKRMDVDAMAMVVLSFFVWWFWNVSF